MPLIRRLIDANRRLCKALERHLPQARVDLYRRYDEQVLAHQRLAPLPLIADVGGGKSCSFAAKLDRSLPTRIVAVDVSPAELALNHDVDEKRVADVGRALPFGDGEVGMIVSRTVLEHVQGVATFVEESSRVLCDGGYSIHLVPCRNAPFAVIARVLPFGLSKALLHFLQPQTVGVVEFPVFYDECTYDDMRECFERAGFRAVDIEVSYYQSEYYDAFFPAYLLSVLYELLIRTLGLRNLAAYLLVVARK